MFENYWIKWRKHCLKGCHCSDTASSENVLWCYIYCILAKPVPQLGCYGAGFKNMDRFFFFFFFHQPNAGTVYYTTSQHVAVHSTESFPNLITGACLNSVTCHTHDRAEYLTSRVTILYFHKEPLIPNIWTRTLLHQHNHFFFSDTLSNMQLLEDKVQHVWAILLK